MEIKTKLEVLKINNISILIEKDFKYYYEELGYSRKKFKNILEVGSKLFIHSLHYYYTDEQIEELRNKKISRTSRKTDNFIRHSYLDKTRAFSDFDLTIYKELLKINSNLEGKLENYEKVESKKELAQELYNTYLTLFQYSLWIKEKIQKIRKSVNNKLGIDLNQELNISFSIRQHELLIADELRNLGIEVKHQYRIRNREFFVFYDLFLPDFNCLIELDTTQFHENNDKDLLKKELAIKEGFKFFSIKYSTQKIRNKLPKIVGEIQTCLNTLK